MTLSEELTWRGFIKDKTFADLQWLDTPRTFYLGTDCSSDSLTIGNLAVYMLARHLAEAGWKAVLLVGGATSLIGDPGGKDAERVLKSKEEIAHNVAAVELQVRRLFAHNEFELVNNYEWFKDIGYLEFLRDVGKHFSMTELVQREFISSRMGEGGGGISYAEFSYNLIQGYDYYWLHKNRQVVLQIGASDQWGNMLSGAPLIRKKEGAEVHALCMPLVINKKTGKKFGKSEDGAVWLAADKTSPEEFYQFWINVDDAGVEDYLKIYTMLSKAEIERVMAEFGQHKADRLAQKTLAYEVTKLVHGEAAAEAAKAHAESLKYVAAQDDVAATVQSGASIVDTLVACGLTSSKSEARQLLADNGIYINDRQISREHFEAADFQDGKLALRRGKKLQNTKIIALE